MRNKATLLLILAAVLSACTTTQPRFQRDQNPGFVCFPGSAIKRAASPGKSYPAWMMRERGSCLHG